MKKILLVFDGTHFSPGAFEWARALNELSPLLLTGVFLPQVDIANLWSYAAAASASTGAPLPIPLLEEEDTELVQENIRHFERLCQGNGITYRVHRDYTNFVLPELKRESRFADLAILSGELFYQGIAGNQSLFLKDALQDAECPVLIVPEKGGLPTSVILAYNGSEESVFAIKQFAYLFPEFTQLPTLLVHAGKVEGTDVPEQEEIVELATQHFKDLTVYKLELNPKKYFGTWISEKKNALVVSGSFGRSTLSQLFRKSFVLEILREHQLPVFIAHK